MRLEEVASTNCLLLIYCLRYPLRFTAASKRPRKRPRVLPFPASCINTGRTNGQGFVWFSGAKYIHNTAGVSAILMRGHSEPNMRCARIMLKQRGVCHGRPGTCRQHLQVRLRWFHDAILLGFECNMGSPARISLTASADRLAWPHVLGAIGEWICSAALGTADHDWKQIPLRLAGRPAGPHRRPQVVLDHHSQ